MRTVIEQRLEDKFIEILLIHHNGKWAAQELDYLVFVQNANTFNNLSEEEQWEVRRFFLSLKQIYGE